MIPDLNPDEMDERQEKLYETSVFLARLLAAGIVFQAILFIYPDTYSLQAGLTGLVSTLLNWIGVPSYYEGIFIFLGESSFRVTQDCLGWKSIAAFMGLMFASSGNLREHRNFILAGISALVVGNVVRVITTIYLSHINLISFEIIHGIFWKWGLTALVLVLWLYWLRKRH